MSTPQWTQAEYLGLCQRRWQFTLRHPDLTLAYKTRPQNTRLTQDPSLPSLFQRCPSLWPVSCFSGPCYHLKQVASPSTKCGLLSYRSRHTRNITLKKMLGPQKSSPCRTSCIAVFLLLCQMLNVVGRNFQRWETGKTAEINPNKSRAGTRSLHLFCEFQCT